MEKIKILAVDNEQPVLDIITATCDGSDTCEIKTELSAIAAAERIRSEKFDVFIIDYQMPMINGIELLEEIKTVYDEKKYKYVGIFCTAYGTMHLFHHEYNVQKLFNIVLEKPFDGTRLLNVITEGITILNEKNSNREE